MSRAIFCHMTSCHYMSPVRYPMNWIGFYSRILNFFLFNFTCWAFNPAPSTYDVGPSILFCVFPHFLFLWDYTVGLYSSQNFRRPSNQVSLSINLYYLKDTYECVRVRACEHVCLCDRKSYTESLVIWACLKLRNFGLCILYYIASLD